MIGHVATSTAPTSKRAYLTIPVARTKAAASPPCTAKTDSAYSSADRWIDDKGRGARALPSSPPARRRVLYAAMKLGSVELVGALSLVAGCVAKVKPHDPAVRVSVSREAPPAA